LLSLPTTERGVPIVNDSHFSVDVRASTARATTRFTASILARAQGFSSVRYVAFTLIFAGFERLVNDGKPVAASAGRRL